jgi:hypothetical protein
MISLTTAATKWHHDKKRVWNQLLLLILRAFHIPPFSVSVYIVFLIVYFMQYSRY